MRAKVLRNETAGLPLHSGNTVKTNIIQTPDNL